MPTHYKCIQLLTKPASFAEHAGLKEPQSRAHGGTYAALNTSSRGGCARRGGLGLRDARLLKVCRFQASLIPRSFEAAVATLMLTAGFLCGSKLQGLDGRHSRVLTG